MSISLFKGALTLDLGTSGEWGFSIGSTGMKNLFPVRSITNSNILNLLQTNILGKITQSAIIPLYGYGSPLQPVGSDKTKWPPLTTWVTLAPEVVDWQNVNSGAASSWKNKVFDGSSYSGVNFGDMPTLVTKPRPMLTGTPGRNPNPNIQNDSGTVSATTGLLVSNNTYPNLNTNPNLSNPVVPPVSQPGTSVSPIVWIVGGIIVLLLLFRK